MHNETRFHVPAGSFRDVHAPHSERPELLPIISDIPDDCAACGRPDAEWSDGVHSICHVGMLEDLAHCA